MCHVDLSKLVHKLLILTSYTVRISEHLDTTDHCFCVSKFSVYFKLHKTLLILFIRDSINLDLPTYLLYVFMGVLVV